jgi:glycosyltransferase involved in cell wall biosynthesis
MRIAIVTPILPVPFDVTRGRFIYEEAKSLSRMAEVKVFLQLARYPRLGGLLPRSYIDGRVDPDQRWDGLDVEAYEYPALPVLTRSINGHLGAARLKPRLRRFAPDVVIAFWAYPEGFSGVRAAHALGKPCVVGVLGSDVLMRSGVTERMTRAALHEADGVIAVSDDLKRVLVSRYGVGSDAVRTVVNGFNTGVFNARPQAECRAELGLPADGRLIVYVGRLIEAKGMRELFAAFGTLTRQDPTIRLAIIGDGVMRDEVHRLARQDGLDGRVHLPGGLPPEQVAQWIGASDLLTLPSWSEGYPNVVVEALACGRPVVGTDVGGMREILRADNGVLVPARDAAALAEGLRQCLGRDWDRAAIAAAMSRTWDDVARDTIAICDAVLDRRR